jgi:hypothetical protein
MAAHLQGAPEIRSLGQAAKPFGLDESAPPDKTFHEYRQ